MNTVRTPRLAYRLRYILYDKVPHRPEKLSCAIGDGFVGADSPMATWSLDAYDAPRRCVRCVNHRPQTLGERDREGSDTARKPFVVG